MECVWLETSYFFKDITITPKVGLRKFKGEKYMSKTKGISKKKNVLKVLWNECITIKVLIFIIAYVVLAFINMPFEKWFEAYSTEFLQGLTHEKTNFIENSFIILPIFEVLAVSKNFRNNKVTL